MGRRSSTPSRFRNCAPCSWCIRPMVHRHQSGAGGDVRSAVLLFRSRKVLRTADQRVTDSKRSHLAIIMRKACAISRTPSDGPSSLAHCLPQAQDQAERHRFKGLVRKYFERVAGGTADLTETGMYKKEIDNMTYHVLKYLQLFPPGNLSYFVYHEPVPAGLPNDGASSSSTRSEPIIVELSDDED